MINHGYFVADARLFSATLISPKNNGTNSNSCRRDGTYNTTKRFPGNNVLSLSQTLWACVCMSADHRNSWIWCPDCHRPLKRAARVFVDSVWCVPLTITNAHKLFPKPTLWAPACTHPPPPARKLKVKTEKEIEKEGWDWMQRQNNTLHPLNDGPRIFISTKKKNVNLWRPDHV